jgi:hypothetical protein
MFDLIIIDLVGLRRYRRQPQSRENILQQSIIISTHDYDNQIIKLNNYENNDN